MANEKEMPIFDMPTLCAVCIFESAVFRFILLALFLLPFCLVGLECLGFDFSLLP